MRGSSGSLPARLSSAAAGPPRAGAEFAGRRILLLAPDALGGRGGVCAYLRGTVEALVAAGARIEVLARHAAADQAAPRPAEERVPRGGRLGYVLALGQRALGPAPDLILCGHLCFSALAAVLGRRWRIPVVHLAYGIEAWRAHYRGVRSALEAADLILAISRDTVARLRSWIQLGTGRLRVLPNPPSTPPPSQDLSAEVEALRRRLRLGEERVLLCVGRMDATERYKGHDLLLEAMPSLRRSHPDATLLMVGEGSDRPRLLGRVEELGLKAAVRLPGWLPPAELEAAYALSRAFAMPSRGEGFGQVFVEAMHRGLPVLAAPGGGEDALRDGSLGIVSHAEDGAAMAEDLRVLLARPRTVPEGVEVFSAGAFAHRLRLFLGPLLRVEGRGR